MYDENYEYDELMEKKFSRNLFISAFAITLVILMVVGGTLVKTYNNLVDLREDVKRAEAGVETMMQRRLELIPDLVKVVKAAANHEEEVFGQIAEARSALQECLKNGGSTEEISAANTELSRQINNLVSVVHESYPEISVSEQYTSLMDQIEGSVNRIAIEREKYNDAVSDYNRAISKFPGSIFASLFNFKEYQQFAADEEAEKTSMVDFE